MVNVLPWWKRTLTRCLAASPHLIMNYIPITAHIVFEYFCNRKENKPKRSNTDWHPLMPPGWWRSQDVNTSEENTHSCTGLNYFDFYQHQDFFSQTCWWKHSTYQEHVRCLLTLQVLISALYEKERAIRMSAPLTVEYLLLPNYFCYHVKPFSPLESCFTLTYFVLRRVRNITTKRNHLGIALFFRRSHGNGPAVARLETKRRCHCCYLECCNE